jgi:hypothetical protein
MLGRHKLLLIIPAIILIPILLGMTPINFVQKIGSGCPFSQGKQLLKINPCPFDSTVSMDDLTPLSLTSSSTVPEPISSANFLITEPISVFSNALFQSFPLRC